MRGFWLKTTAEDIQCCYFDFDFAKVCCKQFKSNLNKSEKMKIKFMSAILEETCKNFQRKLIELKI